MDEGIVLTPTEMHSAFVLDREILDECAKIPEEEFKSLSKQVARKLSEKMEWWYFNGASQQGRVPISESAIYEEPYTYEYSWQGSMQVWRSFSPLSLPRSSEYSDPYSRGL